MRVFYVCVGIVCCLFVVDAVGSAPEGTNCTGSPHRAAKYQVSVR